MELYKLINGKYDCVCMPGINRCTAELPALYETRGHRFKLKQIHCKYNLRQHFFRQIGTYMEQFA